jgi:transcriptional regulator with XRE-family HTH domain
MARHRKIEPEEALKLREKGWTYAQIAEHAGLSVSGVQQIFQSINRVEKRSSHKEALPWTLAKEHSASVVATYLRRLSKIGKGERLQRGDKPNEWAINGVLTWANAILDQGMDVDYDREQPPSEFCSTGGFFLRSEDPENPHLRPLVAKAEAKLAEQESA